MNPHPLWLCMFFTALYLRAITNSPTFLWQNRTRSTQKPSENSFRALSAGKWLRDLANRIDHNDHVCPLIDRSCAAPQKKLKKKEELNKKPQLMFPQRHFVLTSVSVFFLKWFFSPLGCFFFFGSVRWHSFAFDSCAGHGHSACSIRILLYIYLYLYL